MIWLLTALAFAEPLMTPLSEGEAAPFAGRLFNDEAVVSIITMKEFAEEQYNQRCFGFFSSTCGKTAPN